MKHPAPSIILAILLAICLTSFSQGIWTPLNNLAPNLNSGVMLLLTDGTVITNTADDMDVYSTTWNKLTPDSTGSYVNGTWSTIAPMIDTRLYFASQVLQNGKVYVAGGEYGTGSGSAEIYDPLADTWTSIIVVDSSSIIYDGNSQLLPDGRVMQNVVIDDSIGYGIKNFIYDPVADTFSIGAMCLQNADEAPWVKLADNSILFEDFGDTLTERYIPALDLWIRDSSMPFILNDTFVWDNGPGLLLPNGKAFFIGSTGQTLTYTPSGDTTLGSWLATSSVPNGNSMTDGAAAMMADGHILCATSPAPNGYSNDSSFYSPTYFYDYNYITDSFVPVLSPDGFDALYGIVCYETNMLDLPDGTVLFSVQSLNQYYIYTPGNAPLAAGKPTINTVSQTGCDFMITGTLFNGISQGAAYGDDWQMATNYPIVRLIAYGKTYYARTTRWNSTGVQRGALPDTAYFTIPDSTLRSGNYALLLSANGISSDTFNIAFVQCRPAPPTGIADIYNTPVQLKANPNPANGQTELSFTTTAAGNYVIKLTDVCGKILLTQPGQAVPGNNLSTLQLTGIAKGIYMATFEMSGERGTTKIVVQ